MNGITWINLTRTRSFGKLQQIAKPGKRAVESSAVAEQQIAVTDQLYYNYAAKGITAEVEETLIALAAEQQCIAKYQALAAGEPVNTGEQRMVLHHLTRGRLVDEMQSGTEGLEQSYRDQHRRLAQFAAAVHEGHIKGSTGRRFDTVVQIGIGGSDLGPRSIYLGLRNYAARTAAGLKMRAHFISNVDPDDAAEVVSQVDPERTLFILVSKSGTTQETLTNEAFVVELMRRGSAAGLDPHKHMIAVTSQTSPLAKSKAYLDAFFIDDYIGGRYSSTSAVGSAILTLAFGEEIVGEFLAGAHQADVAALQSDPRRNAALMDALIGVYERNVLGYPATAVLPYSQALSRFPAHLQQLDMESNGKSVNRDGDAIDYPTGPIIFGEPGTNGQHSFYQLLHQGTDIVPLQFIGFRASQLEHDVTVDGSTSQTKLNANLAAQIVAFSHGKEDVNSNRAFAGGRSSSLLHAARLTPHTLGALLSHFENKVMFQGFLWNINSFDQEGVQLGKVLAKQLLSGNAGGALGAYAALLGV
ncbi:MAG: glucose-6-phosphate isomerase [Spirochaetaceae bacterium]|nr:MAG: glucose-6-phosphate isomerase [Spirochaetaceae bacterium]